MAKFLTLAQLVQTSETMLRSLLELGRTRVLEPVRQIAEEAKSVADSVRRDADDGRFDGPQGTQGEPGVSPTASFAEVEVGYRLTITDAEGEHSCVLRHGERGEPGGVVTVNGHDGTVVLTAADVGARPADWNPEMPNRNLLLNSHFRIDQRGKSPYTGSGYGLDMWRTNFSGDTVEQMPVGAKNTIASTASGWHMHQIVVDCGYLVGSYVTASIDIAEYTTGGVVAMMSFRDSGDVEISSRYASISDDMITIQGVVPPGTDRIRVGLFAQTSGVTSGYIWIRAVKLEIGSVSTLRYDAPPDDAMEQIKCMAFFVRKAISGSGYITGDKKSRHFIFDLAVRMRTTPVVSIPPTALFTVRGGGGYDSEFPLQGGHPDSAALNYAGMTLPYLTCQINFSSDASTTLDNNTPITFVPVTDAYIDLSSEP